MSCRKKEAKGSKKQEEGGTKRGKGKKKEEETNPSEPAAFPRLLGTTGHFCRLEGLSEKAVRTGVNLSCHSTLPASSHLKGSHLLQRVSK